MNRKYAKGWFGVVVLFVVVVFVSLATTYGMLNDVFAVDNDVNSARQNMAVKVLAKDLSDCYKNAKEEILLSLDNTWANYDSDAYWKNANLQVYYPKYLAGKTGAEESSNCAKMITGWKTNWIVELFTDRGDFVGVDQNVVVPEGGISDDAQDNMQKYLVGVGYKEKTSASTTLNGYKCFYITLEGYKDTFIARWAEGEEVDDPNNWYFDPEYSTGSYNPLFVSEENFCFPVNGEGDIDLKDKQFEWYRYADIEGAIFNRPIEYGVDSGYEGPAPYKYKPINLNNMHGGQVHVDGVGFVEVDKSGNAKFVMPTDLSYVWSANPYMADRSRMIINVIDGNTCNLSSSYEKAKSDLESCIKKMKGHLQSNTSSDPEDERLKLFKNAYVKELDLRNARITFKKGEEKKFVDYFFDQHGDEIVEGGYALGVAEQYMFYYDHLVNYFGKDIPNFIYNDKDAVPDGRDSVEVLWLNTENGTFGKKYLSMSGVNKTACALDVDNAWPGNCKDEEKDWKYFAEKLAAFTEDELKDAFKNISLLDSDYANDVDAQNGGGSQACYSGSGPLGWILCPVIDAINNIGGWMWKNVIEYHLQIPASGVFESGGAVEQAWGIMRNIANVAFIILFLIVIFSQLTGVGIDNYGIKKILPRLIVVAILVNLSYIICELAVDLSNILGMGLNAMLSGFAKFATGLSTDPNLAAGTLDVALGVGGVGLFALLSNPAGWGSMAIMAATIGVMVLGIVLAMLVAVATLYLILIIREAGIILLIILAPVAMVCYMLPNTEKLYKKWFDLFKALLIVYPICGMMIGAGKLAGSVLAKIGNSTGAPSLSIAAMIVQVLPFFLIPKLLKSSLQLMGNVGARLSDAGKRLGAKGTAKVEGAIKGSERFKNLSQYQQERTAANRAGRVQARLRNRMASGKTLSARDQDRLRRADDTVLAWKSREAINGRRTSEQSYAARQAAIATEDEKARVADYESLIENGRARNNSGSLINVNDPNSVGTYHAEALARYEAATNDAERSEAMSQIKAAQNILSKTDKGRAQVQNNLAAALQAGQVSGLSGASAHLMSNFGDTYKNKNRGAHEMIRDLATTDLSKSAELTGLQSKLTNGKYAFAGTKSYTAETLAGADDAALDKFVDGVTNGSLTGNELANIQATAYEALQKAKSGTLNIKPEVSQKLEQIVGNNYVPVAPNNRAAVLSHGAYEDSRGNVVHLREMDNGKYLDDGGFEVDITHYKKR